MSDQGFDELPAEVRTHHTFHYCAQQESKQRAQPDFRPGLSCCLPISSPARLRERAEDDAPRHEEQPYDGAYGQPRVPHRLPPLYLLPSIGTK